MRIIYPVIFAAAVLLVFGLFEILLFRTLNKEWWRRKMIRRMAIILPLLGVVGVITWFTAAYHRIAWLSLIGSTTTAAVLVLLLGLMLSLPFSGILHKIRRWLETRRSRVSTQPLDEKRRIFLKGAAAALPIATIAMSAGGVTRAFGDTNIDLKPMVFPDLPPQLERFKILHISDSHLGVYKFLPDLEYILRKAEEYRPDMILVTGDVADDLGLLPDALAMIADYAAPFGAYACLGNHEYYRGINQVLAIYGKSRVPLLRDSSVSVDVHGHKLYVAGTDDPVTIRRDTTDFTRQTVTRSLAGAPPDAFTILMAHRPEAFYYAPGLGADLVLAGHMHGGQVGINGRSVFEPLMPETFLWGKYSSGSAQMYLSCGIGHWFPFRLGCPPEAPIIQLLKKA